jgi:hypothetical protein
MNSHLLSVAERVVSVAVDLIKKSGIDDKTGGIFYCTRWSSGRFLLMAAIGINDPKQVPARMAVAQEKAYRVCLLSELTSFTTSYDSRNPELIRWGGAVGIESCDGRGDLVLSFSGLPELWDEAAMFVTAVRSHDVSEDIVLAQISEERNPYLRPLLAVAHWTE